MAPQPQSANSAAQFNLNPLERFQSTRTSIKRPRHLLEFSFDDQHQIHCLSDRSLRHYYPPYIETAGVRPPRVDLSNGFERWQRHDDSVDTHLDGLLQTLQAHEERLLEEGVRVEDVRVKADVVTWRGMMTKILTTAFDPFSEFEMNATSYQGTIYIEEDHASKAAEEQRSKQSYRPRPGESSQEMMQYWGYKFESLSTIPLPWAEVSREGIANRDAEVVNNSSQYCSIVRTGIGNTSIILAGEVDCVLGGKPDSTTYNPSVYASSPEAAAQASTGAVEQIPWVELKTTAETNTAHPREAQKFERKLLRFWAQSFLLGVPRVIVGFRSKEGILTRIDEFETQRIPGMVAAREKTWDGNICISATAAFLEFMKATIAGDGAEEGGVWRVSRKRDEKVIRVFKVQDMGTGELLREEFKKHRERLLALEIAEKLGGSAAGNKDADQV